MKKILSVSKNIFPEAGSKKPVELSEWQSRISAEFSKPEKELLRWMIGHPESAMFLISELKPFMNKDIVCDGWFERTPDLTDLSQKELLIGSTLVIYEIRQFGGHTLNLFGDKPHYENVLAGVHQRLCKRYKKNYPEVAGVEYRENDIASMMMGEAISQMSPEEIASALKGSNFSPTKESQKEVLTNLIRTGGLGAVYKLVGKKFIKELILKALGSQLKQMLGEQAAKMVLKKLALKVPQKVFKSFIGWVGIGLLVKDFIDLGGEATRFTTPMIINISISRMLEREFQIEIGEN